ncbi:MAG: Hsp20/alpha crystallin family protein [Pseudomonadota bacterium]
MAEDEDEDDGARARARADLSLLTLLGPFREAIRELAERAESVEREARSAVTIETGRGPVTAHTEIRVRLGGVDDVLAAREAGDGPRPRRPSTGPAGAGRGAPRGAATKQAARPASPEPAPPRTPDHEVIEDAGLWIVTVEMPGAEADATTVTLAEGRLRIAATGPRPYALSLDLPEGVTGETPQWSLRNGLLEVTLPLAGGAAG